jgi:hypothetical protein
MKDELNVVALAAEYKGGLSAEYVEALTRAFEVYCGICDRVERKYAESHPQPDDEEEFGAWLDTVYGLKHDAFIELLLTVGVENPNRLSSAGMPTRTVQ